MNKLNNLIDKYELTNIIKVIIILLILYLAYRLFTSTHEKFNDNSYDNTNSNVIEGFADIENGVIYGNVLPLLNTQNTPSYAGNTCTFQLDKVYRIDTLKFVFNSATGNGVTGTAYSSTGENSNIHVQYVDANNVKHYITGTPAGIESPPKYTATGTTPTLTLSAIKDIFVKDVFTSQIILTIGGSSNDIAAYKDTTKNGYISQFGIFGGSVNLPSLTDYNNISSNTAEKLLFSSLIPSTPTKNPTNVYSLSTDRDQLIYALQFEYNITTNPATIGASTNFLTTLKPFIINITYTNKVYPSNTFTIKNAYYVRSDTNRLKDVSSSENKQYIFFNSDEGIIANNIIFTVESILDNNNNKYYFNCTSLAAECRLPQSADISAFQKTVKMINGINDNSNSICPSINELVDTQTKTQQICDNLEYQDKIKSEKIRLQRNQQYLLKLKDQQDQVDQLNQVIQDLENKRQMRAQSADQLRVLQYQKQKSDASTIRDLANQRLESQDNNQLYLDVILNTI